MLYAAALAALPQHAAAFAPEIAPQRVPAAEPWLPSVHECYLAAVPAHSTQSMRFCCCVLLAAAAVVD